MGRCMDLHKVVGHGMQNVFADAQLLSMNEPTTECGNDGTGQLYEKQYITTKKNKWTVSLRIGDGGYGSVYKVKNENGEEAAMKVEKHEAKKRCKLEMEVTVLKAMHSAKFKEPVPPEEHFVELFDRAKKANFSLIVMTIVGQSLAELRRLKRPSIFTLSTVYPLAIKTLEPIEYMHKNGFIHRDIKPGNYAIGRGNKRHLVYILDFGIARKYLKDEDQIKTPRRKIAFRGTVRYAALACHELKELGPKDDVESWLYMIVDFANPEGCNWKGERDKDKVYNLKQIARTDEGRTRLFTGLDLKDMSLMLAYIDGLKIVDRIDYDYFVKLLKRSAKTAKVSIKGPFEWEVKDPSQNRMSVSQDRRQRTSMISMDLKPQAFAPLKGDFKGQRKKRTSDTKNAASVMVSATRSVEHP